MSNSQKDEKVTRVANASAAGTTQVDTSSVDMAGFDSVKFYTSFGAIASSAVTSVHVATSSDNSTWNDLEGTSISVADDDDNGVTVHEIVSPQERYLRIEVAKATANSTVDGVIAVQYNSRKKPATDDTTTVIGSETHISPAEGTA